MKLIRLIYCSRPTETFRYTDLAPILRAAARNNRTLDVNGLLALTNTHFIQVVEGYRSAVSQLYTRLLRDPRHTDVTLFGVEEIRQREFSSWRMGFIAAGHLQSDRVANVTGLPKVMPEVMGNEAVLNALRDVLQNHDIPDAAEAAGDFVPQENVFEVAI